jgi:uncharacterized protein
VRFEWDEAKRLSNLQKHGLDFADAAMVFEGVRTEVMDDRADYGEERWITLGLLGHLVVVIVYTERSATGVARIISMRKATRIEREAYERELQNRLGPP